MPFVASATTRLTSIFDYAMWEQVTCADDWDENNEAIGRGMQTRIDFGCPSRLGEKLLLLLSAINASLGILLRLSAGNGTDQVFGEIPGAGLATLSCFIVTFLCSWFCYRTIFIVAFQWYMSLSFMQQIAKVLSINGATREHLPCYIDLRHPGNLESW
jgi:hypothetical protein